MGDGAKVKVAVRVRPINKRELDLKTYCCIDMRNNDTFLDNREDSKKPRKKFAYDHCFWSIDPSDERFASQEVVFDALGRSVLQSSFDGYNACIFAYGQTGSGKSYTMMGLSQDEKLKGVIPRLCDSMFAKIAENKDTRLSYKVEVSYMEIYCERVRDLLCGKETKHNLKVREHNTLGTYVEGLSTLAVRSFWDIESIMLEGNKSRTVAATQMNAESSRSHAVFSIVLTQTLFDPETNAGNEKVSRTGLVDLAGSERAGKSGALGERLKEGSNINKSLHTLGLVISALAEISAGKKPRGSHVPYRDSTLTWLLKDSLGGNSKTVMIATVSPASDNYEETLSTLRYADRAKKIVNHAVVNEDPNSKVIRELREEVEKLRQLLNGQGGSPLGSGSTSNPANSQDVMKLQEKLAISESLMQEMSKTWEQKLVESEKLHEERQKALEDMGISVKSAGIGVQRDKFYFVNLNADPIMSELLVCYLKPHTKIGRPDAEVQQDIQLKGLGIQPEHCVVEVVNAEVYITSLLDARTLVNGKIISERTKLCHGYRVLLGNNHFFRLSCPKKKAVKATVAAGAVPMEGQDDLGATSSSSVVEPQDEISDEEIDESAMNYDFAMKEVILNELNSDPTSVYQQMKQSMEQQHIHEKQDALEQQKVHYERQLAEMRDQLQDVGEHVSTSPPAGSRRPHGHVMFSPMLEAEWEMENSQRLMETYFRANTLVREANMLSQTLDKDTVLKVTMQIPPSLLSPIVMGEDGHHQAGGNEIAVRVLQKARGTDSVWSMETLEEKVVAMRELFQMQEDGKYLTDDDATMDPFFDIEQHVLLGVANIFTQCLFHRVCHQYDAPIIGPTGKVCGTLKVSLERVQVPISDDVDGEEDTDYSGAGSGWEVLKDTEGDLVVGSQIGVKINVIEAAGLPSAYCHFAFGQYKFWGQLEPTTLAPLQAFSPGFGKPDKSQEAELKFDHIQVVPVEVTEDFLDYLEYGTLSVEVYGHRRTGFTLADPIASLDEDRQHMSFPDRCCEVMKNLEMWVGILELNDQGNYVPVVIEERKDVKCGGLYVLRQGQSRRIQVKVAPVKGSGDSPLNCMHITSMSIGSIYLRHRNDEPLDGYQDIDLDRLRGKWADALMRRRDYLDKELRKIMEKKGRTKGDSDKEQELIDQWTMLLMERSALLQPKPGSGVPGAPTRWKMSPGMECRVTTLYLDLNDDMLTPCDDEDPMAAIATAPLLGEKDESMINLLLIKRNDAVPEAVASWDSSVHDAPCLNRTTANNDRVYAILKVSVLLEHPPGIELVLRKRLCLRIVKKVGFFTRLFTSAASYSQTGAMYEVVTGIPKLEGMFRPPKIPSHHPSFVEVEENENVVEKFKEGMMSVRNILALDRLKQEVSLKERLASSSLLIHPSVTTSSNEPDINQSEERQDNTPPPQEEFPHQPSYLYNYGDNLGPGVCVIQDSSEVVQNSREENQTAIPTLDVPSISVTTGTPPLLLQETAQVMEQNEAMTDTSADDDELVSTSDTGLTELVNSDDNATKQVGAPLFQRQGLERRSRTAASKIVPNRRACSLERLSSVSRRQFDAPSSEPIARRRSVDVSLLIDAQSGSRMKSREKSPERKSVRSTIKEKYPDQRSVAVRGKSPERRVVTTSGSSHNMASRTSHQVASTTSKDKTQLLASAKSSNSSLSSLTITEEEATTKRDQQAIVSDQQAVAIDQQAITNDEQMASIDQQPIANDQQTVAIDQQPITNDEQMASIDQQPIANDQQAVAIDQQPITNDEQMASIDQQARVHNMQATVDNQQAIASNQPPYALGERVMIDTPTGYKFGKVKYIGQTVLGKGEWIGIALEKPTGKHDGTVKGVKYFKCKDKHGLFVRRDKVIRDPSLTSHSPIGGSPSRQRAASNSASNSPSSTRRASNPRV